MNHPMALCFQSGHSVMVDVATGGGSTSGEMVRNVYFHITSRKQHVRSLIKGMTADCKITRPHTAFVDCTIYHHCKPSDIRGNHALGKHVKQACWLIVIIYRG